MKILSGGLLLNLFISAISGASLRALQQQRYIIKHPIDLDPFIGISTEELSELKKYNIGEQTFSIANLSEHDASLINQTLANKGSIEIDGPIDIPSNNLDMEDQPIIESEEGNLLLNDVPLCKATVNNVDIFVVDSVIFTNLDEFSEVEITNLPAAVDPTPCSVHGTEVAAIIGGKNVGVITQGNRRIYGIGVFNCAGRGTISGIVYAFNQVLEHDKITRKEGRRTIVNFSGTSSSNSVVDYIAKSLVDAGIPVFAAAGNFAADASGYSPARSPHVYTLGATQYPGNVLATFSNFGSTVNAYLPGSPVTTVNTFYGGKKTSRGTSFSSPIGLAEGAIELSNDIAATPVQIYQRITDRTITVNSSIGPIQVMLQKDACPVNRRLFTLYNTIPADNNKFNTWYGSINNKNSNMCVKFLARFLTNKGQMFIGLRQNATDTNLVKIKIGARVRNNLFEHNIQADGKVSAQKRTRGRIVSTKSNKALQIEQVNRTLTISYMSGSKKVTLLNAKQDTDYNDISFSAGAGGRARYSNVFTC